MSTTVTSDSSPIGAIVGAAWTAGCIGTEECEGASCWWGDTATASSTQPLVELTTCASISSNINSASALRPFLSAVSSITASVSSPRAISALSGLRGPSLGAASLSALEQTSEDGKLCHSYT